MKTKFHKAIKALEQERRIIVADAVSLMLGSFHKTDNLNTAGILRLVNRNKVITQDINDAINLLKSNDKAR